MAEQPTTPAPALDRGLRIVAALAAHPQGLGFNEIADRFHLSKSVCSRLLSVLIAHRWVVKAATDGRYYLDQHAPVRGLRQELEDCDAAEVLPGLAEDTGCTAILVVQDGDGLRTVAKHATAASPRMRPVGSIRYTWLTYPWAWCILIDRDKAVIAQILRQERPANDILADFTRARRDLAQQGWCWQRGADAVRLACPIRDRRGRIGAALALGGHPDRLDRSDRARAGALLVTVARDLANRLAS